MSADLGFLHLAKAEPTLLPPAPDPVSSHQIEHRRLDEVHACFCCGKRAQLAFVAHTELGNRWLDLCHECANPVYLSAGDQG